MPLTRTIVQRPSDDMIIKTIETGENTRQLISLCAKMEQASIKVLDVTLQRAVQYRFDMIQCDAAHSYFIAQGEPKSSTKFADLLHLGFATFQKKQIWQEYARGLEDFKKYTTQIGQVLRSLLNDQETLGAEIKTGSLRVKKLSIIFNTLDNTWAKIRHVYSDIGTLRNKIHQFDTGTGTMRLTVPNMETGKDEILEKSLKDIAKAKQTLVDPLPPYNVYLREVHSNENHCSAPLRASEGSDEIERKISICQDALKYEEMSEQQRKLQERVAELTLQGATAESSETKAKNAGKKQGSHGHEKSADDSAANSGQAAVNEKAQVETVIG